MNSLKLSRLLALGLAAAVLGAAQVSFAAEGLLPAAPGLEAAWGDAAGVLRLERPSLHLLAAPQTPSPERQALLNAALRRAVNGDNVAEITRLVRLGANPNAFDQDSETPLSLAAMNGFDNLIGPLIALGAQVNFKGLCDSTALHYAAAAGDMASVKALVAHQAAIDAATCYGETPLIQAAENLYSDSINDRHLDVLTYLLGKGVNPNAQNLEGKSALMLAVEFPGQGSVKAATALLAAKANANLDAQDGMTALKLAVKGTDADMVRLLLQAPGINVNDNAGGVTALFLAQVNGEDAIAQLLEAAGAR